MQISAAFLPGMVKSGKSFLIDVASMAGYMPTRMAVHGAAEAFVLSFTESLCAETRGTVAISGGGISVLAKGTGMP